MLKDDCCLVDVLVTVAVAPSYLPRAHLPMPCARECRYVHEYIIQNVCFVEIMKLLFLSHTKSQSIILRLPSIFKQTKNDFFSSKEDYNQ